MEQVKVYLPPDESVPVFLQNAQLVALEENPTDCVRIQRNRLCACDSIDCIVVPKNEHALNAFPCYALPTHCTPDKLVTVITWITRHCFMTFEWEIRNRNFDRYVAPNNSFASLVQSMQRTSFGSGSRILYEGNCRFGSKQRSHPRKRLVMQRPGKYEMLHAMRYAHECTKKYLMEAYSREYPNLFRHARIEIRPATKTDYYCPPTLASKCIVVEKTYFTEEGCTNISCYPYRDDGLPCTASDAMRWTRLGSTHVLSCQPSCRVSEATVDTEWRNGTCVRVNPFKKFFARFPETIFEVKSKNPLHDGLDWKDGTIYLNANYCKAFGLDFDGSDCSSSWGQDALEFVFGTTIVRGIKLASVKPADIPPPHPLPNVQVDFPDLQLSVPDIPVDPNEWAREVVSEIAIDFGIDVAMDVAKNILKKRAPKLLTKSAANIPLKGALAQMVLKYSVTLGTKSLVSAGKIIGGVSNAFTVFSILSVVLDIFDPLKFGHVLNRKMVETINKRLDLLYFEREDNFAPELTPEFVWDHILVPKDLSERTLYFGERLKEYLDALQVGDELKDVPAPMFDYEFRKENTSWNWTIHITVMIMLLVLAILFAQWVHVWALIVFFAVMMMKESSEMI